MPTPTATIFVPYHALDDVILRGTRAAQPPASAVVAGTLYCVTDEGARVERSSGTAWQVYSPTPGGGGAGTGDVVGPGVATDQAIALYDGTTGKLLQDSATPIAALALKAAANVFTRAQTIDPGTSAVNAVLYIRDQSGEGALIALTDLLAPTDGRLVYLKAQGGSLTFTAVTDLGLGKWAVQFYNGAMYFRPPTGGAPTILLSKDTSDTGPDYPRLVGLAGALELRRFDNAARINLLAAGLGDTPLNATSLTSGTVPDARLSANVQLKPIAAADLPAHATRHQPGGADAMAVDAVAATGSLRTLGTGAQQAAPGNDARFTPSAPLAHHVSHEPGGSDPLTVDAVAATGSLRTLGTGPQQAAPGNDARFAAGTAAHHASHEPGGADALVNAAWTDQANVFTQNQRITKDYPGLYQTHPSAPANARTWQFVADGVNVWHLQAVTDDLATVLTSPLRATRAGDVLAQRDLYEKQRATAVGHWTDVPFTASIYTAAGAMTWTVTAGQQATHRYTLIGRTLVWAVAINGSTLGGTASTSLRITVPAGLTTLATMLGGAGFGYLGGAWQPIMIQGNPGQTWVDVFTQNAGLFPLGTAYIQFTLSLEV